MSRLERELLEVMAAGVETLLPEAEFNRLALAAFAHQWEWNAPYRTLCQVRGKTPSTIGDWTEVPAVATSAFKFADLTTVPEEQVGVVYVTSGTTRGGERRGRHLLPDTRLYDASLRPNFQAHLLPDRERIRMLVWGPSAPYFPQSSLGHMNSRVLEELGTSGSGAFWTDQGPCFPELFEALTAAEREGTPVCLLGTAFGFVHLLDWLGERDARFQLPPGSRIMDTGGYKGRSREVPKPELYRLYEERLGIPATHIVNEYGMTELGSQFYDTGLRELVRTGSAGPRRKIPPPWVRTRVMDPETLTPLPRGTVGLLCHFDLANLHTVSAIQTDDLGVWGEDGFEVLGRAAGAEPRGCSLAVEEFLAARANQ